jgi:hypothetical protein
MLAVLRLSREEAGCHRRLGKRVCENAKDWTTISVEERKKPSLILTHAQLLDSPVHPSSLEGDRRMLAGCRQSVSNHPEAGCHEKVGENILIAVGDTMSPSLRSAVNTLPNLENLQYARERCLDYDAIDDYLS